MILEALGGPVRPARTGRAAGPSPITWAPAPRGCASGWYPARAAPHPQRHRPPSRGGPRPRGGAARSCCSPTITTPGPTAGWTRPRARPPPWSWPAPWASSSAAAIRPRRTHRLRDLGRRGVHAHGLDGVGRAERGDAGAGRRGLPERGRLHLGRHAVGERRPLAAPLPLRGGARGPRPEGTRHRLRRVAGGEPGQRPRLRGGGGARTDDPPVRILGSGSDYTVFFNHIGVPSVDAVFDGPYGVYHSIYDTHDWMRRFGDPGFAYHAAMARLWGLMALRLANAEVLPVRLRASTAATSSSISTTSRPWPRARNVDVDLGRGASRGAAPWPRLPAGRAGPRSGRSPPPATPRCMQAERDLLAPRRDPPPALVPPPRLRAAAHLRGGDAARASARRSWPATRRPRASRRPCWPTRCGGRRRRSPRRCRRRPARIVRGIDVREHERARAVDLQDGLGLLHDHVVPHGRGHPRERARGHGVHRLLVDRVAHPRLELA